MFIETLAVGPLQVNCFIVACEQSHKAAVIDPGDDGEYILAAIEDAGLSVEMIVNTHGHFDHIGGNRHLVAETGAELMIHAADLALLQDAQSHAGIYGLSVTTSPQPDRLLDGGDTVAVGRLEFKVLHVPGHSPGSICLFSNGHLFVGDVLFAGSIGRTDLPGGSFDQLVEGIRENLFDYPDETVVHTGHGPDTTIGREREGNPFVGKAAWE